MIIEFLDNQQNTEENFNNIIQYLNDQKITTNMYDLKTLLYIITNISNEHHRYQFFFQKIEILRFLIKEK